MVGKKKPASRFLEGATVTVIIVAFAAFNAAPFYVALGIIVMLVLGLIGIGLFQTPFVSDREASEANKKY